MGVTFMKSKKQSSKNTLAVRIISLALAVLMLLSVVMAAVWRW